MYQYISDQPLNKEDRNYDNNKLDSSSSLKKLLDIVDLQTSFDIQPNPGVSSPFISSSALQDFVGIQSPHIDHALQDQEFA